MFRRDVTSCGERKLSNLTLGSLRPTASAAGPADGPRARYGVQGSNCRFAFSSIQTGTRTSVGRIGGAKHVDCTDRQATGASAEASLVYTQRDLSGRGFAAEDTVEGLGPFRMMCTLSSDWMSP